MGFNLNEELYVQDVAGEKKTFTAPDGNPVTFWLVSGQGNTEFFAACQKEKTKIESDRRLKSGGKKIRNVARLAVLQNDSEVREAEYQQIQRQLAPGRIFRAFDPVEWDGLQVTQENLEKMIGLNWVWNLVREYCIFEDDSLVLEETGDEEDAEKKSEPSSAGISDTEGDEESSPPAPKKGTKSTKSK